MCKEEEEVFSFGLIRLPRLSASERWRAMRRGWVWVLCGFFVIPRSDMREARSDSKLEQARSACGCEGVPPLSPPRQRSG